MNKQIQYLRGIASILVVFAHFKGVPFISSICGAIGVDIFFIISGYIMNLIIPKYSNNTLLFIKNRIIRIFPLYILVSIPLWINGGFQNVLKSVLFIGGDFFHIFRSNIVCWMFFAFGNHILCNNYQI